MMLSGAVLGARLFQDVGPSGDAVWRSAGGRLLQDVGPSGDAVWRSDGGRLFQDVGPVCVKARCPAEESFALGTLYRRVSEEERSLLGGT